MSDRDSEPELEEEPDVIVDEKYSSLAKVNERLPEGVFLDGKELVVHGETYRVHELVNQAKNKAKGKGPATYALTMGGVTLGLLVSGPFAGAAAASGGAIIGALYDRGYLEFTEDGPRLNIGDDTECVDPGEAKMIDPLEVHEDKWYEPDSDNYDIAVKLSDGKRRYYKTEEGAANRLIEEYGV